MNLWLLIAAAAVLLIGGSFLVEFFEHAVARVHGLRDLLGFAACAALLLAIGAFAVVLGQALLEQLFEPAQYDHRATFVKLGAVAALFASASVAGIVAEGKPARSRPAGKRR